MIIIKVIIFIALFYSLVKVITISILAHFLFEKNIKEMKNKHSISLDSLENYLITFFFLPQIPFLIEAFFISEAISNTTSYYMDFKLDTKLHKKIRAFFSTRKFLINRIINFYLPFDGTDRIK